MISIVPATEEGAAFIAAGMQRPHREECEGAGMTAAGALAVSLSSAAVAEMALADGEPIAMWGLNPGAMLGGSAIVWMLGTDALKRYPIYLCRYTKRFMDSAQAIYPTLECVTDIRYPTGCAWLEWLGFREASRVATPATIYAVYRRA